MIEMCNGWVWQLGILWRFGGRGGSQVKIHTNNGSNLFLCLAFMIVDGLILIRYKYTRS